MAWVRLVIRLRAAPLGQYLRRPATSWTSARVSSETSSLSLNTRDTVATETPASRATSLMLAMENSRLPAAREARAARDGAWEQRLAVVGLELAPRLADRGRRAGFEQDVGPRRVDVDRRAVAE